jgi:hypothetical protein
MQMVTRNIVETIAASHFLADEGQVSRLTYAVLEGQAADVTYFRVLLAHVRQKVGRRANVNAEAVLDKVHDKFYPIVLGAVGPESMKEADRNRKATFARSAASTIRFYIRQGGDVREIDLSTVTKSGLRSSVQTTEQEIEGETKADRAFRKLEKRYLTSIQRYVARGDPDQVTEHIEQVIAQLEALLQEESEETQAQQPEVSVSPQIMRHHLTRVPQRVRRAAQ